MGKLLALDLATSVGWALLQRGQAPRFGTERLPGMAHGARFARLHDWLGEAHSLFLVDAVAFEEPILPRKAGDLATTMATLTFLWGLAAVVQLWAAQRGMPCQGVSVQHAKLALTNKQHAKKDEMVVAAMQVMNWRVSNDHEADAGAVGLVAYPRIWPKTRAAP